METKKTVDQQSQLLNARQEALEFAAKQSIRPLGKLWGMDVFVWYNPTVYELSATISAFPFPVFWLGKSETIEEMAQVDPETLRTVQWCGQYDSAEITIPSDVLASIPLVTATENVTDALKFLKGFKASKHIVLFTFHGNEWKTNYQEFEQFVQINK
jgi:hypothetical protein